MKDNDDVAGLPTVANSRLRLGHVATRDATLVARLSTFIGLFVIGLFKDTSLAAAIAVPELTFEARKINVETFRVVETWIVASGPYIATCSILAALLRRVEARLSV